MNPVNQTTWQPFPPSLPDTPVSPISYVRSANLLELIRNELFKLRKRRLVWGLLIADLVFVFAAW